MGQSFVVESARRSTICSRHSLFIQGWKVDTDIAKRLNGWAIPMEELEIGRQVFVY